MLVCGNGGSAADAEHIVGELMKGFLLPRRLTPDIQSKLRKSAGEDGERLCVSLQIALPAISLASHTSLLSAFGNDVGVHLAFAQQVLGYGAAGDVLLGISTSGKSENVILALKTARSLGLVTLGLTGLSGGLMSECCDVTIKAPADNTHEIQEYHLPIYHAVCAEVEAHFFGSV